MKKIITILIMFAIFSPISVFANLSHDENTSDLDQEHYHNFECEENHEIECNKEISINTLENDLEIIQPYEVIIHVCHIGPSHAICDSYRVSHDCGCFETYYYCCCGLNMAYHFHYCDIHGF